MLQQWCRAPYQEARDIGVPQYWVMLILMAWIQWGSLRLFAIKSLLSPLTQLISNHQEDILRLCKYSLSGNPPIIVGNIDEFLIQSLICIV